MSEEIERIPGQHLDIVLRLNRCIHSRVCVVTRPDVFVPNVEGEWVHPDAAPAEMVAEIARNCPSGAISVDRHDGGPAETAPKVNTIRIRENGPLAIQAELSVAGDKTSFRATLCRCGASRNKPYCDGSHHEANFLATGEPDTQTGPQITSRDGPLEVTPAPNGPLLVSGAMEILSGTGRSVLRTERAALCRCGASQNKPFCDGSHVKVGFTDA
jgi:CDGSH-type Zn-finger protein/uncharacterized Fe-S cluster protein YjdI